uniref:Exonuclease 1 n=1 Tax=Globisporangium ultimum (strain ATCC 200006 / CBS 805.95 / DAOM BR144) TaxID=431595 RepID=K3X5V7_GLOUD
MGVAGLLPALKSVMDQVHIAKYAQKTVGIDAAGWLYKGAYSCPMDVVLRNKDADGYLNYCMQQIKLLEEHRVTPIFVFDGGHLPAKAGLNAERSRSREIWKTKALRQLESGDESGSYSAFSRAVSVTNEMVMKFIAVLRRMNITFYVAPYEADAQLAYLSRQKIIDAVISEDSDCIPYGCKTILFKWSHEGWASELKRRSLGANEELSFVGWTEDMFIQLCVLCGCDYCPSIPGVGIVTAYKFVETYKSPMKVMAALEQQKHSAIPPKYAENFYSAIITFRHHLVFDPRDKKLKMLNPLTLSKDILHLVDKELHFLGDIELRDDVVALIASGKVHPVTLESYDWKKLAAELEEGRQFSLPPNPSARSMTSTESSIVDRPEKSRQDYDDQSSHGTDFSEAAARERGASLQRQRSKKRKHDAGRKANVEQPKPASTSWNHLDSVLGSSVHILNFRSPKVSDNFRPLVSLSNHAPFPHGSNATTELKEFENRPVRQNVKRIKNPTNRRREENGSGFEGEVSCRIDSSSASQRPFRSSQLDSKSASSKEDDAVSTPVPALLPIMNEPLRRPLPFAPRNTSYYPENVANSSSLGEESGSEILWALPSFQDKPRAPPSVYSTYSRATYVEEKWDRILGAEVNESSESGSSQMQIVHSQSTTSAASENANTVASS